jgi:dihydroorotate dehydrogenase (NAD+) catalytic subunit
VGVGTALFYDPLVCNSINAGLAQYLSAHGLASIHALSGDLHTLPPKLEANYC